MTRQEAIEDLKVLRFNHNVMINGTNHTSKALDMAIEALELMKTKQQAIKASNLIDRQAAIDAIKTWGLIDGLAEGQATEILADEEKLPSAEPKVNGVGDLISKEFMKSLGGACIARRLKDGDLCPIISIDLLPSAEPRKKGKWIVYESSDGLVRRCTCDQCGYETHGKQWRNPNFCPNCGCQMKGEEDE